MSANRTLGLVAIGQLLLTLLAFVLAGSLNQSPTPSLAWFTLLGPAALSFHMQGGQWSGPLVFYAIETVVCFGIIFYSSKVRSAGLRGALMLAFALCWLAFGFLNVNINAV